MRKTGLSVMGAALLLGAGCEGLLDLNRFEVASDSAGGAGGVMSVGGRGGTGGAGGQPQCDDGCLTAHRLFGGPGADVGRALTISDGRLLVYAEYSDGFDVFQHSLPVAVDSNLVAFELALNFDSSSWAIPFEGANVDEAQSIQTRGQDTILCGAYTAPLTGLPLNNGLNPFVTRVDATGALLWSEPILATEDGSCNAALATAEGVFAAGNVGGVVTTALGDEPRDENGDIFLARLDPFDGDVSRIDFGDGDGSESIAWLAPHPDGRHLIAVGRVRGDLIFLGATLGDTDQNNTNNAFVFSFDTQTNTVAWFMSIVPKAGKVAPEHVVVDANGDVHLVGSFEGTADFGDGDRISRDEDGFYVHINGSGTGELGPEAIVDSLIFGGENNDTALSVAVSPVNGEIAIGIEFTEEVDIQGLGTRDAAGAKDGGIARLSPTGALLRFHTVGSQGKDIIWGVAFDGADIVATGEVGSSAFVDGLIGLGSGFGASDIFVGRFAPAP